MKKRLFVLALISVLCTSCNGKKEYLSLNKKFKPDDNGVFKDLGDYTIELEYKHADFNAARAYLDKKLGIVDGVLPENPVQGEFTYTKIGGCTTASVLNDDGQVIIGRNLDNEVSVCPAFFIHTSFGKYKTLSVRYNNYDTYTYTDFKAFGYKDQEYMNYIPFCVTDALNEKGLFVEANVREPDLYFMNTGTNPSKERVLVNMLVQLIAMNCATVNDALNYLRNDINIVSTPYIDMKTPTQYGYCIGDAEGNYGVIEIARNQVHFVPYVQAQGNYYLTPIFAAYETNGSGYGRAESVLDGLDQVNDIEGMLEQMKKPMWYKHILYAEYAYQDENGVAHFVDDKGNKVPDWRSDFSNILPVDPATGHICTDNPTEEMCQYSDVRWMMDESHFDEMKAGIVSFLNTIGWKEKLVKYYQGDEMPLRQARTIFTTGVSYAVNCAEKTMLVKLWEKENLTYKIKL